MIWLLGYLAIGWGVFGVGCIIDQYELSWSTFLFFGAVTMVIWLPYLVLLAIVGVCILVERCFRG